MNSSRFKEEQLKYLAYLLQCKTEDITYLCENLDKFYHKWVEEKINAKTGKPKTYPDGTIKKRTIRPSLDQLKKIQKIIKASILSKVPLPENIQGSVKGKSNISNAKKHQGNKYKFCTDLQEFYPSVTHKQTFNMFLKQGYSNHVAHWLTKLTTIENELPQGTPTSPAIANIVFLPIDKKLIELCDANGITYTRYVDDLTFSSSKDFRHLTVQMLEIVTTGGFKISYRKTSYKGKQTITGIEVFNNFIDAPKKIKQQAAEEKISARAIKPYSIYLKNIRKTNKKATASKI